jgi:hypothetical protein
MIRKEPCTACPYRIDVPSGLWAPEEYDKLPPYDEELINQPIGYFACHATPEHLCHGWAVVGGWDLLALRIYAATHEDLEIPQPVVPLFESHQEAAEHGRADIDTPSDTAVKTINRLVKKYPRLKYGDDDD